MYFFVLRVPSHAMSINTRQNQVLEPHDSVKIRPRELIWHRTKRAQGEDRHILMQRDGICYLLSSFCRAEKHHKLCYIISPAKILAVSDAHSREPCACACNRYIIEDPRTRLQPITAEPTSNADASSSSTKSIGLSRVLGSCASH
jgi:hypothetical protein